jgi:chromosomal replication initiation ATPase DnaA
MALDLDAFVVGPANRLAVAAARRVADTPGTTYNPLFVYSGSGLGKTHLLGSIGHQVDRVHGVPVVYDTMEHFLEEISAAVAAGDPDIFRGRLRDTGLLLLDDVQFLAGQRQVQEELLRAWDALAARGAQVVLTSDRPPQEIDALDDRLLSRLSGGLIVDMAPPDFETRIAIARRKAEERGCALDPEVYQALARVAFTNVRELQGALNRLIAVQELEGRSVSADEVPDLLGVAAARGADEFGEFLSEISGTVSAVVEEGDRVLGDAILAWEGEGYRTRRLDSALNGTLTTAQAETVVERFERDVGRLEAIAAEIRELEPEARELETDVLRDPDRLAEAEGLLQGVRERNSPPPAPPPGRRFGELESGDSLAVRAARAVARAPGAAYNPLYVMGPAGSGRTTLLVALAGALQDDQGLTVGFVGGATFAEELISALERSRLDAWRARSRQAEALVLDDLDQLAGMERGHKELFHLFEELHREGRQLVFSATVSPQDLPFPPRLQSRLEAGLVVELEPRDRPLATGTAPDPDRPEPWPGAGQEPEPDAPAGVGKRGRPGRRRREPAADPFSLAVKLDPADHLGMDEARADEAEESGAPASSSVPLLENREKVLWEWPYAQDWIEESPD